MVDAKEVAALIEKFCDGIRAIIRLNPDASGDEEPMISVCEIRHESLGLAFKAESQVAAAYDTFCTAVERGNVGALPEPSRDLARSVRRFAAEKKCSANFYSRGSVHASAVIDGQTKLENESDIWLKGKIVLYGKLERLGGKTPRAVVVSRANEQRYSCLVTEAQAKELGARLYDIVGLECEGDWQWDGQATTELKVREILPYRHTSATDAFGELRSALKRPLGEAVDWEDDEREIG